MNHEARVIMLNECEQLWASRAAQALDARLTNHVVAPSVNPALYAVMLLFWHKTQPVFHTGFNLFVSLTYSIILTTFYSLFLLTHLHTSINTCC